MPSSTSREKSVAHAISRLAGERAAEVETTGLNVSDPEGGSVDFAVDEHPIPRTFLAACGCRAAKP